MLDIFSRPKKERKSHANLIAIDYRERNSLVPSEISTLKVPFTFEHLQAGDYLVGETIIERKSLSDLQSSIIDKRIFRQIIQLKAQNRPVIILIELGNLKDIYGGIIHENALRGFFLSLSRDKTISYIFSKDEKDTAKYLCLLNQKVTKKHISVRPSRILQTKEQVQQFILEGFPGIGPATAKKLLEKFKTIRNILNADEKELKNILGIKYERFRQIID